MVCLLEAGQSDSSPFVQVPAGFLKVIYDPKYTWGFNTEPVPGANGRTIAMIQHESGPFRTLSSSFRNGPLKIQPRNVTENPSYADDGRRI